MASHSAEDFKSFSERGMVARLKQAKRYSREAGIALQNIEVVSMMTLHVGDVADVIFFFFFFFGKRFISRNLEN